MFNQINSCAFSPEKFSMFGQYFLAIIGNPGSKRIITDILYLNELMSDKISIIEIDNKLLA